jgi:hypothetical protein
MENFSQDMLVGEEAAGRQKLGPSFVLPITQQGNTP